METDRYWGVHYRYYPALRIDLEGGRAPRNGVFLCVPVRVRGSLHACLRVCEGWVGCGTKVFDDFSTDVGGASRRHRTRKIEGKTGRNRTDLVFLLQRRHGRAALLPALEQLPVKHDVRFPSASADRSVRRRHAGLQ